MFVTLVLGNQALLYVLRDRRHLWRTRPGTWVVVASLADIVIVSSLALSGLLMAPVPRLLLVLTLVSASAFALLLDQVKRPVMSWLDV
jgi:H+-transporting ATPase